MHSTPRFLTSPHQRRRLVLWALAMLAWVAAVVFADPRISARHVRRRGHISIDGLARLTINLLILRAAELAAYRPRKLILWRRGRDRRRRHFLRSLVGSKLRRVLKHRDAATRIARLIGVLRDLDLYAALLAKRFRRRLTRLCSIAAGSAPQHVFAMTPAPAPAYADSS